MTITKLNQLQAIRYMGYGNNMPDKNIQAIIDHCEAKLIEVIKPRYVYKVADIVRTDKGISLAGTSLVLTGNSIAMHLEQCNKCIIMCATISDGADKLVRIFEATDMTRAMITDCLASAAIEQVCELADEEIKSQLDGYHFTWRYAPGYGDLPLEIQGEFLEVLNAPKRIGVNVTDALLMTPKKSVTSIVGLSEATLPKGQRGCATCNLKSTCAYRKRGDFCGF